jgi:hypothetical protein
LKTQKNFTFSVSKGPVPVDMLIKWAFDSHTTGLLGIKERFMLEAIVAWLTFTCLFLLNFLPKCRKSIESNLLGEGIRKPSKEGSIFGCFCLVCAYEKRLKTISWLEKRKWTRQQWSQMIIYVATDEWLFADEKRN